MTQAEQALLSLIRRSLFQSAEDFSPDTDWNAVLTEAKQQSVVGIAAEALPDSCSKEVRAAWKTAAQQQFVRSIFYWNIQDELLRLFAENDVPYVILKGTAAAMYYPSPFRRAMGDIDLLVSPEQFDHACAVLTENGYTPVPVQNDRHIVYAKASVHVELHHTFSYLDLDLEEAIQSGLPRAERCVVKGHTFYALPAIENGLVLLAHLWDHLHTGVGLRQLIDWMLFVHAHLDDRLWTAAFSSMAKKYRLEKTAIVATRTCQLHLGLPADAAWCASAEAPLCEQLLSTILHSGNFGRKAANADKTAKKAQTVLSNMHRYGLLQILQTRGELNWSVCQKHPWLKPFAWLYQLIRYPVLWFRSPRHRKLSSLIEAEKERTKLLRRLK